jgi:diaminohydroxyphosphoribosylaminopyrimidine deaminase/5-amino-6-(5-phosphoribosylamino)uracil reductase
MNKDIIFMKLALALAKKGIGKTNPNPIVGAVIVKDGRIVAKGYHKEFGKEHAEVNAIKNAKEDIPGATLYVTLEPCVHYGHTPPCVDAIIKSGIKKVVIATSDPNPIVNGKGIRKLRKNGIEVKVGVLEKEAKEINKVYFHYIKTGFPYVTVKAAMSIDGKIATETGNSKWISSISSRKEVSKLRTQIDGIMVGVNTIIKDDPLLIPRYHKSEKKPIRIVVDTYCRIPLSSRVIKDKSAKTLIATTRLANKRKIEMLKKLNVEYIILKRKNEYVDIISLMKELAKRGISHILIEGGGKLIASAFKNKIVNEVKIFIAPKIIGGENALTLVEGVKTMNQAIELTNMRFKRIGHDILLEADVKYD